MVARTSNHKLSIVVWQASDSQVGFKLLDRTLFALSGSLYDIDEVVIGVEGQSIERARELFARHFPGGKTRVVLHEVLESGGLQDCPDVSSLASGRFVALIRPGVYPYEHAYSTLVREVDRLGVPGIAGGFHIAVPEVGGDKMASRVEAAAPGAKFPGTAVFDTSHPEFARLWETWSDAGQGTAQDADGAGTFPVHAEPLFLVAGAMDVARLGPPAREASSTDGATLRADLASRRSQAQPGVDIITRTFQRPILLERALKSILDQTYENWTWVLVDGGNTAEVPALLEKYKRELRDRVTYVPFVSNQPRMRGVPINTGIRAGSNPLITLLDDDDTWAPEFLSKMVAGLVDDKPHPTVRGIVCRTTCIEETSVEDGLRKLGERPLNDDLHNVTLAKLSMVNCFCTHAFVYEREVIAEIGGYPEDYPVLEDWHFNLRFVQNFEISVLPEVLTYYHFRPSNTDTSEANSQVAEVRHHKFHEGRLINEALREDLRLGRLGLGHVLAQAATMRWLGDKQHNLNSKVKAIGEKIGKIDARTKAVKDNMAPRK
ncbi:glycosyltransferase [Verrucomicrobium sp. BvORR106]|uniref:glycosyltransferase n=1 Tax=Verrucomicrobium sp. BvORR106 TaxID=1403819 RepID=UPI00056FA330|nr:glycosyltransferase [Verrucomicrobium sp. BvORR106]